MNVTEKMRHYIYSTVTNVDVYEDLLDIADDIDEQFYKMFDNINLPVSADGEICHLDDVVYYGGVKHVIVAISHKNKVNIRHALRNDSKGAFWVKASEVYGKKEKEED